MVQLWNKFSIPRDFFFSKISRAKPFFSSCHYSPPVKVAWGRSTYFLVQFAFVNQFYVILGSGDLRVYLRSEAPSQPCVFFCFVFWAREGTSTAAVSMPPGRVPPVFYSLLLLLCLLLLFDRNVYCRVQIDPVSTPDSRPWRKRKLDYGICESIARLQVYCVLLMEGEKATFYCLANNLINTWEKQSIDLRVYVLKTCLIIFESKILCEQMIQMQT